VEPAPRPENAARLVRSLYEQYQARDWGAAEQLLHPEVELRMPATGEVLAGRDDVLGFQVNYPEPWGELRVLQVVGGDTPTAAVELEIVGPEQVFRCAAFWESREGHLHRGTEYWVTVGADEPGPR
jgi:ketosteroid isomerase-like protein